MVISFLLGLFSWVCMHTRACVYVGINMSLTTWRSEINFQVSILSFYIVGARDWSQVLCLGLRSFIYCVIPSSPVDEFLKLCCHFLFMMLIVLGFLWVFCFICFYWLLSLDRVLYCQIWPGTHCVVNYDFELLMLLTPPS